MKRIFALLLAALLMMTAIVPSLAEQPAETSVPETSVPETSAPEETPVPEIIIEKDHLVVGNPTPMRGEFFTELWGNATSDIDVRDLLHGYNLIYWNNELGLFDADPTVVREVTVTDDANGDRTFTMVLQDDLYYSDGSKITAWDYAFSYLFMIAPELTDIGATPLRREQFYGYVEYMNGSKQLAGVRVRADNVISVKLRHEFLPFFYEMGLLMCNPYPIKVIAPGVVVRDDGLGVYLANEDPEITEPLFTSELLKTTVMDKETGYLSHPSVVSGPYTILSWDGVTAEFELNPYFKYNVKRLKPIIRRLTYTLAVNDTMIEKLEKGEFGLLNKVMRADKISEGIELTGRGPFDMTDYPRIGLSYISFCCEKDTVSSLAVRQAIAYCMDRDQVTKDYTGVFGQRVDGWYGIGQWMYRVVMGLMPLPIIRPRNTQDAAAVRAYEVQVEEFRKLNLDGLNPYGVRLERAMQLLDNDGWKLNENGLREKDGVVLDLKLIYPEGNNIPPSLDKNLVENLKKVGIGLTMEARPMVDLLTEWYKQDEREVDMIYLATNFYLVFDPSVHFLTQDDGTHNWSYTNLHDEPLYQAAVDMRKTEPGDTLTYLKRWIAFQERFNEVLPMLPVYSNMYYDFYTDSLEEYWIEENVTWGQAIVGAYLTEK